MKTFNDFITEAKEPPKIPAEHTAHKLANHIAKHFNGKKYSSDHQDKFASTQTHTVVIKSKAHRKLLSRHLEDHGFKKEEGKVYSKNPSEKGKTWGHRYTHENGGQVDIHHDGHEHEQKLRVTGIKHSKTSKRKPANPWAGGMYD